MTAATARAAEPAVNPVGEVPRDYNFAADILDRNLNAGRADKPVYIHPRGEWTYGQLANRVARFSAALGASVCSQWIRLRLSCRAPSKWTACSSGVTPHSGP